MSGTLFSLILNGVIIVLLGATIVYAGRLSANIRVFRDSRKDMDKLVRDLGKQIEKADQAIADMRDAAKSAGRKLQDTIDQARAMSDELQLMTESGNNLASRLEKGRPGVKAPEAPARGRKVEKTEKARPGPSFNIRDPEFGRDEDDQGLDEAAFDDAGGGGLQSKAERELYEALHKRGKAKTGGGA